MSTRKTIALVDTNVWLDCYLPDRPNSVATRDYICMAQQNSVQLAYPVHILKDVFYLIQLDLKRMARKNGAGTESDFLAVQRAAWSCIENMREQAIAIGADESDAWLACRGYGECSLPPRFQKITGCPRRYVGHARYC